MESSGVQYVYFTPVLHRVVMRMRRTTKVAKSDEGAMSTKLNLELRVQGTTGEAYDGQETS